MSNCSGGLVSATMWKCDANVIPQVRKIQLSDNDFDERYGSFEFFINRLKDDPTLSITLEPLPETNILRFTHLCKMESRDFNFTFHVKVDVV